MKKSLLLLFVFSLLVTACGPGKLAENETLKNPTARKVIRYHTKTEPNFKTLNARLKGTYDDGNDKQSISVSMRIKKDETIWLSAKLAGLIPLAKLMVTPDRVQFYEKINNQYFDGDFSLLSNWLGVEVDFEKFQNLLFGNVLDPLDKNEYYLQDTEEGFVLNSKENKVLDKIFLLDKQTLKLKSQRYKKANWAAKDLEINYPSYKRQKNFLFPDKIDIIVNEKGMETEIKIDYRSLEFNKSLSFPFKMPTGYKEIELK